MGQKQDQYAIHVIGNGTNEPKVEHAGGTGYAGRSGWYVELNGTYQLYDLGNEVALERALTAGEAACEVCPPRV